MDKEKLMGKIVGKIERKDNNEYIITPTGEIIEIEKKYRVIDKIGVRENCRYYIDIDGNVREKEIVYLSLDEFYEYKKSGKLAEIFREGKEVEVKAENEPLFALEKYENAFLISSLQGRRIERVEVKRKQGNKELVLHLDNGKKLKLSHGLLTGSSAIEIE